MLVHPKYGYGANANPCVDCRVFMMRAREGDHGGARGPTSSSPARCSASARRASGATRCASSSATAASTGGSCARSPRSSSPPTIPEQEGLVDRERLEDISGRSRQRQMELAQRARRRRLAAARGRLLLPHRRELRARSSSTCSTRARRPGEARRIVPRRRRPPLDGPPLPALAAREARRGPHRGRERAPRAPRGRARAPRGAGRARAGGARRGRAHLGGARARRAHRRALRQGQGRGRRWPSSGGRASSSRRTRSSPSATRRASSGCGSELAAARPRPPAAPPRRASRRQRRLAGPRDARRRASRFRDSTPLRSRGASTASALPRARRTSLEGGRMAQKRIYTFGGGKAEGNKDMKDLLGGKGAGLAEMSQHRHPGPAGLHHHDRGLHRVLPLRQEAAEGARGRASAPRSKKTEALTGKRFGDAKNPLLVSVRSGARVSMPGMMDTVLNLGLNDATVEGLARAVRQPALRLGQLPPLRRDVRRRRPRHEAASARRTAIRSRSSSSAKKHARGVAVRLRAPRGRAPRARLGVQGARSRSARATTFPDDPYEQLLEAIARGVPLLGQRPRHRLPQAVRLPVGLGHRRQRPVDGVRQHGRRLRHRRRVHAQPGDRRRTASTASSW